MKLPENHTLSSPLAGEDKGGGLSPHPNLPPQRGEGTLLKVSISQDPLLLKPHLSVTAEVKDDNEAKLLFTIDCNYFLFIHRSELTLYDENLKKLKVLPLPNPLPLHYSIPMKELPHTKTLHYQLSVFDEKGREDRTGLGMLNILEGSQKA